MAKRPEKKSETLEVRLPYSQKLAFMAACKEEKVTASDVVRTFIEGYVAEPAAAQSAVPGALTPNEMGMSFKASPRTMAVAAAGVSGLALLMSATTAANGAVRETRDAEREGELSLSDIRVPQPAPVHAKTEADDGIVTRTEIASTAEVVRIEDQQVRLDGEDVRRLKGVRARFDLSGETVSETELVTITEQVPAGATDVEVQALRQKIERRLAKANIDDA